MADGKSPSRYRLWLLAGGVVLFLYVLIRLDPAAVLSVVRRIRWGFLWMVLLFVGHQLVRTFALSRCLVAGPPASFWELVKIRLSGEAVQFLTLTGPFLAEPAKALLLKRQGIQTTHAFGAIAAEFLIYTFTSAAIAIAGLQYLRKYFELEVQSCPIQDEPGEEADSNTR
jgi:Lysylphosphatidylglycerol synthase TM region